MFAKSFHINQNNMKNFIIKLFWYTIGIVLIYGPTILAVYIRG